MSMGTRDLGYGLDDDDLDNASKYVLLFFYNVLPPDIFIVWPFSCCLNDACEDMKTLTGYLADSLILIKS